MADDRTGTWRRWAIRALTAVLRRRAPAPASSGCTVTVCRGCCCGTPAKHPDVDHARQLRRLCTGVGARDRVRVSGCLDLCDESNVVVVSPSVAARRRGARPVWLAEILDDRSIDAILRWVGTGGPGASELPPGLRPHAVVPTRQGRRALSGHPG
jgi:hypothetical protein